jgi:hypothetical protein
MSATVSGLIGSSPALSKARRWKAVGRALSLSPSSRGARGASGWHGIGPSVGWAERVRSGMGWRGSGGLRGAFYGPGDREHRHHHDGADRGGTGRMADFAKSPCPPSFAAISRPTAAFAEVCSTIPDEFHDYNRNEIGHFSHRDLVFYKQSIVEPSRCSDQSGGSTVVPSISRPSGCFRSAAMRSSSANS